jgi:ABC-type nickel/cobalt efflux system permease component RcnA
MSAMKRVRIAIVAALLLLPFGATAVLAHPLGNFTINHHTGIRVEPARVLLDVVIDEAEIPAFQATLQVDRNGDGSLSAAELDAARAPECETVAKGLTLQVADATARLRLIDAGLTFPPGNGGLSTMRLVCTLEAPLAQPLTAGTTISFRDDFEPSRLGWREITVVGDRVTTVDPGVPSSSDTGRLTSYPTGLTGAPDIRNVTFTVSPGGPALAAFSVPDASPVGPIELPLPGEAAGPAVAEVPVANPVSAGAGSSTAGTGTQSAVPGGEGPIPEILRSSPITPAIALIALFTAALLGAGHAVTPGHGKTLMAAYLVGTRGTPRHAVGLGLAVSVSHTAGILALAVVVVGAAGILPPDLVARIAPLIAAVTILAIGGWMLITELRRGLAARRRIALEAGEHDHAHGHSHDDEAGDHNHRAGDHAHPHLNAHAHAHEDEDPHSHDRPVTAHNDELEHSHAGIRHRHVPPAGATISWRSLFVLGLAGGLIPSTNALLILLATIASGRPAWGVVLVVAFGLGMAGVMTGVGIGFVYARGWLERVSTRTRVAGAMRFVPVAAAVLVLFVGIGLTSQAIVTASFR